MRSITLKRIAERLEALGKSASAASMQAGLGRSSIRDILSGKAKNPRIDTLRNLAGPLQCSIEYLLGESDVLDGTLLPRVPGDGRAVSAVLMDSAWVIEFGVFRSPSLSLKKRGLNRPLPLDYGDNRYPGYSFGVYLLDDDTLAPRNILKGDLLTVAEPFEASSIVPFNPGDIVVVSRMIGDNPAEERSARVVSIVDGRVNLLIAAEPEHDPIIIGDTPKQDDEVFSEDDLWNVYILEDGRITIDGVVVQVTRRL